MWDAGLIKLMVTPGSAAEFDSALQQLLEEHECLLVSSRHLASEARSHYEQSQIFDMESGKAGHEAFFIYLVDNAIAIFLFDGDPFLVYAFSCDPHELITHVESEFTPHDVEECKTYVVDLLGKDAAITADPSLVYEWMGCNER